MKALVLIEKPNDTFACNMLKSSLSFPQPVSVLDETDTHFKICLYECGDKTELNDRLTCLCEASSVDFSYGYKFM